jgi:hypothetical protein
MAVCLWCTDSVKRIFPMDYYSHVKWKRTSTFRLVWRLIMSNHVSQLKSITEFIEFLGKSYNFQHFWTEEKHHIILRIQSEYVRAWIQNSSSFIIYHLWRSCCGRKWKSVFGIWRVGELFLGDNMARKSVKTSICPRSVASIQYRNAAVSKLTALCECGFEDLKHGYHKLSDHMPRLYARKASDITRQEKMMMCLTKERSICWVLKCRRNRPTE